MRALIVAGSANLEREYGIASAHRVADSLLRRGWVVDVTDGGDLRAVMSTLLQRRHEIVVPVGFGPIAGEDGSIWTLATAAGIACAGPTPEAGTLCTNKRLFSRYVRAEFADDPLVDVPTEVLVTDRMTIDEACVLVAQIRGPYVVKPGLGGSSIDLAVVTDRQEACATAIRGAQLHGIMLVQQLVAPSREFTLTTLDEIGGTRALPLIELNRGTALIMGATEKFGDNARQRHLVNPDVAPELNARLKQLILRLHKGIGARGLLRVDVLVTTMETIIVLEANPLPGLLRESLAVEAAWAAGLSFDDLAERFALSALLPAPPPLVAGRMCTR